MANPDQDDLVDVDMDVDNMLDEQLIDLNDEHVGGDIMQFRELRGGRGFMYPMAPRPLNLTLTAYSVGLMPGVERENVDHGGKSK
jgi:hypothetical protein